MRPLTLRTRSHRVANLIKAWVREHMDHEETNRDLLLRIREFAMNTMLEKGQSLQICKSVDERVIGSRPRLSLSPPIEILTKFQLHLSDARCRAADRRQLGPWPLAFADHPPESQEDQIPRH